MTTPPIPASIADACAAHDRHRLSVLDALLDEATPTAVRELLGAALDLCATLYADRDEREAAITATFAKHRAEIDAATARAALARLEVSLVAPVDPEAVARAYHDDNSGPSDLTVPYWRGLSLNARAAAKNAMRATLTAHGIPVTPEAGK